MALLVLVLHSGAIELIIGGPTSIKSCAWKIKVSTEFLSFSLSGLSRISQTLIFLGLKHEFLESMSAWEQVV